MFIARVSRGRTVRECLLAVLIVPTALSVVWMTAVRLVVNDGFTGVQDIALELKLFEMLTRLP